MNGYLSSPTVSMTSLFFTVAVIAVAEERSVITADVLRAYLNTDIEKNVHMTIGKDLAKLMLELKPDNY